MLQRQARLLLAEVAIYLPLAGLFLFFVLRSLAQPISELYRHGERWHYALLALLLIYAQAVLLDGTLSLISRMLQRLRNAL